jgi:hypothetical protein
MTTAVNEWVPQVGAALFQKRLARGEAVLGRFLAARPALPGKLGDVLEHGARRGRLQAHSSLWTRQRAL